MGLDYGSFWQHKRYAVVGNSAKRSFPLLTYQGLKKLGKKVTAVDVATANVDGDSSVENLTQLPQAVDAVVLELPKEDTAGAVAQAAAAGIRNVWIHQGTEIPELWQRPRRLGLSSSMELVP